MSGQAFDRSTVAVVNGAKPMLRIVVVGTGAMGSYFAAKLAASGNAVTVIDVDRERLELLARVGLVVNDDSGTDTVPVDACVAAEAKSPADLLILFTKGMDSAQAIEDTRHLIGPDTIGLTLQNGLGNDGLLAEAIDHPRVVIGMTDVPAELTGPNSVASHGKANVAIGGYVAEGINSAKQVAAVLARAGFAVEVDPEIRSQIWEKVAFNAAMNATASVTGLAVGGLNSTAGRAVINAASREVADVAEASGIAIDRKRIAKKIENALHHHGHHKPSMLQDLRAGRRTEIETINGAVVRGGDQVGVSTPVNEVLANLVRMIERERTE